MYNEKLHSTNSLFFIFLAVLLLNCQKISRDARLWILVAAEVARPRGVHMIEGRRGDRHHAADFPIFNQEHLRHEDAGRPVKAWELVRAAVGKSSFAHRALVKDRMGPDNAALAIHQRETATMNILNHKIDAQLELGQAIHGKEIDCIRGLVGWFRNIRCRSSVLNAMAVIGEGIRSRAVDALAIIFLQPCESSRRQRRSTPGGTSAALEEST